jgi:hypothetical protein
VERSDLAKRFLIAGWERGRGERGKADIMRLKLREVQPLAQGLTAGRRKS